MITDSTLRADTPLGRLVRLPLRIVKPHSHVRILRGPARGLRWIAGSSSHGCWLGTYEPDVLREFTQRVGSGIVVYDVGANVGLFTLAAAQRDARVFAFEPLPRNVGFLRRHMTMNNTSTVTVVEAAVARASGVVRFRAEPTGLEGAVDDSGDLEVRAIALDDFRGPAPHVIKIDVEGGELGVLRGAEATIARARPVIFLEVHPGCEPARAWIEELGYEVRELGDDRRLLALPR